MSEQRIAAIALGKGAYMASVTYCPRCGMQRIATGPFGDCTRCRAPGFISDPDEAETKRREWES